jgi:hypothetical protein
MSTPVSHLARTIFMIGLCAATAMASAEIHRCKDDSGKTVLSDRPCGAASSGQSGQTSVGSGLDRINARDMQGGRDNSAQYEILSVRSSGRNERGAETQR